MHRTSITNSAVVLVLGLLYVRRDLVGLIVNTSEWRTHAVERRAEQRGESEKGDVEKDWEDIYTRLVYSENNPAAAAEAASQHLREQLLQAMLGTYSG